MEATTNGPTEQEEAAAQAELVEAATRNLSSLTSTEVLDLDDLI